MSIGGHDQVGPLGYFLPKLKQCSVITQVEDRVTQVLLKDVLDQTVCFCPATAMSDDDVFIMRQGYWTKRTLDRWEFFGHIISLYDSGNKLHRHLHQRPSVRQEGEPGCIGCQKQGNRTVLLRRAIQSRQYTAVTR